MRLDQGAIAIRIERPRRGNPPPPIYLIAAETNVFLSTEDGNRMLREPQ